MKLMKAMSVSNFNELFSRMQSIFAGKYSPIRQKNVLLFEDVNSAVSLFHLEFGNLTASPIAESFADNSITMTDVVNMIYYKYNRKWYQQWISIMDSEYNPLFNVDGKEKKVITTDYGKIVTDNGTDNHTTTFTQTSDSSYTYGKGEQLDTYGYNNSSASPDNKVTQSGTDTSRAGSTSTVVGGTNGNTETASGRDTVTEEYERAGNIGVTKSTELLGDSVELWQRALMGFQNLVFRDIAEELTLSGWFEEY